MIQTLSISCVTWLKINTKPQMRNVAAIFREEATSILLCFHVAPLCWSNWDLECWFFRSEEKGKTLGAGREPTNLHMAQGRNRTRMHWWEASTPARPLRHPCSANWPLLSRNWFGLSRNDNVSSNWCGTVSRRRAERNYLIELAKFLNKVIIR